MNFTKESVLDLVVVGFSRDTSRVPERQSVEEAVDNFLLPFPHLRPDREWILAQALGVLVTGVGKAVELVNPDDYDEWLSACDRSSWRTWPWLQLYLKERLRRPSAVLDELHRSTDRVLDLIGNPRREGLWDHRGMVVGHVQSGKTQHYTALAAKAIDAGFKIVIILSGIHENLRQQTQERIEEYITGKNSRDGFSPFGVREFAAKYKASDKPDHEPADISSLTSVAGDYGAAVNRTIDVALGETPVIMVVKKNVSILRNVLGKIRGQIGFHKAMAYPMLVIDDEADHSSVNVAKTDEDVDPTRINELIRKLLWAGNKVAFVGYTATPYANIFMEDKWVPKPDDRSLADDQFGSDLFPRGFIISLQPPTNYIGPEIVFGSDGDEVAGLAARPPLPMHVLVEDEDVEQWIPRKHKSSQIVSAKVPVSLQEALRAFVLSIAARTAIGQDSTHCSMLVHVTRFNAVQEQVMSQVVTYLEGLRTDLESDVNREGVFESLRKLWERLFVDPFPLFQAHPSQTLVPPRLPEWSEVEGNIIPALSRLTFAAVNSLSKDNLDYAGNKEDGLIVVAVGGDRLSRGLTLEGLTVSYFTRGAKAYDTQMQMGRWFGYRPGYAHLCRIYAPSAVVDNFKMITLATEELRREFNRMSYLNLRPVDYGLRVREPRADLLVTAMNKMRRGVTIKVHFSNSLVSSLDISEPMIEGNFEAFRSLLDFLESNCGNAETNIRGKETPNHLWRNVSWDNIATFLAAYHANTNPCLINEGGQSPLRSYIESVRKFGDLGSWTVVVVGRSKFPPVFPTKPYLAISRKLETASGKPTSPKSPGRLTFQGVAIGSDESFDLTEAEFGRAEQMALILDSKAESYRQVRPSSRGLLLIYPILTQIMGVDGKTANFPTARPVIGIALSFPHSSHDTGYDYVCNPQNIRELLGPIHEDLDRDDTEDQENAAASSQ